MKRFLAILLMVAFVAWAAPVSAIKVETEKVEKKDEPQPAEKTSDSQPAGEKAQTATQSGDTQLEELRRKVVESKTDEKAPKYDVFPDANNDGVNDRVSKTKSDEGAKPNSAVKMAQPKTRTAPKTTIKAAPKTKTKPASPNTTTKKKSETTSAKKKPN